ncbi:hypothetical protein CH64_119 [Yersinia rohdei]|uniref:AbiJ N-terminal domain-containing protein n=1 Tax=Yersinia rohdei TaxID=29485 RepID=A0ABM5SBF4_YERRO|nr:hypothetical protein [Yersinia rohdei]AJJ10633.1 hypothetical protein CH64_119 [Yersinia rohdei]EEQ04168.1 hypothetical protein yrohd0001_37990 [Yersinia rohdei ATCC 43380]
MTSKLSGTELLKLQKLILANFNTSNWQELAALTNYLDEVDNHPRLLRSLSFGDDDYNGLALTFLKKFIGLNDENLDVVKHYIFSECESSGEDISSNKSTGRKVVFSPDVFNLPDEDIDPNLVSVMMPFNPSLSQVYNSIQSAARRQRFSCSRADDIWESSTIIQDVFSLIFRSFIVVCDFSGKNPNVFYEAGIAHTLGKHVIPITQSENDIPFDLQHHRYIKYLNNSEGLIQLENDLYSRFLTLNKKRKISW